jgi:hypothetical protein
MSRALLTLALAIVASLSFGLWQHRSAPDAVAARLCRSHYRSVRTAVDSARIDSLRTLTRGGVVAPHTCGELRAAGRTR